jgi:hypothetical protein
MYNTAKWWDANVPAGVIPQEHQRDRAAALLAETSAIETRQGSWHEFNLWNSTLFYNRELPAFRWGNLAADQELFPANLRTENLVESIGEAMLSKACSQPLIPSPVPHGESYTAKKAVEKLQKFIAATWRQTEAENAAVQSFLDAYVSSIGAVEVIYDNETLSVEPIFFDNLIIDNRECTNRAPPRTVRKRVALPRAAVEARYGEFANDMGEQNRNYVDYREVGQDWVILVEAWRRPDHSGKGGRHTIVCCNCILQDEEWKEDWLPVVFFNWADPGSGFFGKSGVEQCIPYQVMQNELNDAIKQTIDICCRPRILAHANSNIDINQWDNEFGRILGYTGTEPKPFIWPTEINELLQERERNRAATYSYFGLSEMSANADLPSQVRLDSSAGVREFRNMEDARHLRLWTRFEQFRLTIAHRFLDVLGRAGSKASKFKASYLGGPRSSAKMISYDDIKEIQKEQYTWTLEAVPLSSQSPAARRETLMAWQAQGKIKPTDDVAMIGNPDLERIDEQEMAGVDDIKRYMELMETGDYESPAEYTNFVWGIPEVVANLKRLKRFKEGVHPEAIALHERWVLEALNTQKSAIAAMQQQMPPPGFDPNQGVQGQIQ